MIRWPLGVVVFLSGASVMVLELIGSRVLAPYVGTSIFVWTSLIGVVLASLSLGYLWGGRLADRAPSSGALALILFGAGLWVGLLAPFASVILETLVRHITDVRIGSVLAATVLFTVPSVLMGMVSPYAVRLLIHDVTHSGRTVGALYALSTIGSIVGTFLAGFVLVAYLSNPQVLMIVCGTLLVTSFVANPRRLLPVRLGTTILLGGFLLLGPRGLGVTERAGLLDVNTLYSRALIYDRDMPTLEGDQATVRHLRIGNENSGAMFLDYWELVYDYTNYFRLAHHFQPRTGKTLLIGGGAYAYPVVFLHEHPEGAMDVVEIDAKITELAREYFFVPDDPRLQVFHEDGRTYLNRTEERYDAILVDAFRSMSYVPHHLVTVEAFQHMYDALTDDGVLAANLLGHLEGEGSDLLDSILTTLGTVFPTVLVFPVQAPDDPAQSQNIMVVALKGPAMSWDSADERITACLSHQWKGNPKPGAQVLRDDFSPVDHLVLKAVPSQVDHDLFLETLSTARPPTPSAGK